MKILQDIPELKRPTSIAIGSFDGLHLGHQAVIDQMKAVAQTQNLETLVFTFANHPLDTLAPERAPALLTLASEKTQLLSSCGLDYLLMPVFDLAFSQQSAEDFIEEILLKKLKAQHIAVGYNFHFGHGASGSPATLEKYSQTHGFSLSVIPPLEFQGQVVSSSQIRQFFLDGAFDLALQRLKGQYLIRGTVVRGQGIAAKVLGVPTANLAIDAKKLLPPQGVYSCRVQVPGQADTYTGVMNIGNRPTFSGQTLSVEVYLMDFSGDLYHQDLDVYPKHYLRPEQRFEGPEALKQQIHQDIEQAQILLRESP